MTTQTAMDGSGGKTYAWYARFAPMYLALLPLSIALGPWIPASIWETLGIVAGAPAVLSVFLSEKGRDRGRRLQEGLWKSWGGPLITQYLRHRNSVINPHLKVEYHRKLALLLPNVTIPTPEQEQSHPDDADVVYDACSEHIVGVVRAEPERFWEAFRENRSYGFRRNLWGLKPFGIFNSLLGCGVLGGAQGYHWQSAPAIDPILALGFGACAVSLAAWCFLVTSEWIKVPSDAYAKRVLEALPRMTEEDRLG